MSSWAVTVTAFVSVVVAGVVLQVAAHAKPDVVPAFGRVLTWAMRRRSTQLFVVFVWWWLGWHFTTNR